MNGTQYSPNVRDIRNTFAEALPFCRENEMLELTGVSFLANEESIFGKVNRDYITRELEWYASQSLNVYDIPGGPPEIWKKVAADDGTILSNYGYLFMSGENGAPAPGQDYWTKHVSQFQQVVAELKRDRTSRRAVAVYTNPEVHWDAVQNGRQDFICTNTVQYLIRRGMVHAVVQMRSNDAIFGYRNDYAWQLSALQAVAIAVGLPVGNITWQAGSLHIYPRHRWLVEHFVDSGEWNIPVKRKKEEA